MVKPTLEEIAVSSNSNKTESTIDATVESYSESPFTLLRNIISVKQNTYDASPSETLLKEIIDLTTVLDAYRNLEKIAIMDAKTGVYDYEKIKPTMVKQVFSMAQRNHNDPGYKGFSVVMVDIDNFKNFNTKYGHPIGDKVLQEVAGTCKRECDIFARYGGGEEFIFVLPDTDKNGAMVFAEKVRKHIEKHMVKTEKGNLGVTVSMGVAEWDGKSDYEGLVEQADKALYAAKNTGRNKVVGYTPGIEDNELVLRKKNAYSNMLECA